MVKPLTFKGDKRSRKRKAPHPESSLQSEVDSITVAEADDGDTWVTSESAKDVTGPIIITFISSKPMCLACDANGKVFVSELENIVAGDLATAEPHDIRQVWTAGSIAGTDEISFKGHHGRYLSCHKDGILSATCEAISPEESFRCIASSQVPETFGIQTVREKFFTVAAESKTPEVRGDADSISLNSSFRIRMQARFKPRFRADRELKIREQVSRKELEEVVGRKLEENEVKGLKKARMQGNFHEAILDVRVKGKHDKYS